MTAFYVWAEFFKALPDELAVVEISARTVDEVYRIEVDGEMFSVDCFY